MRASAHACYRRASTQTPVTRCFQWTAVTLDMSDITSFATEGAAAVHALALMNADFVRPVSAWTVYSVSSIS